MSVHRCRAFLRSVGSSSTDRKDVARACQLEPAQPKQQSNLASMISAVRDQLLQHVFHCFRGHLAELSGSPEKAGVCCQSVGSNIRPTCSSIRSNALFFQTSQNRLEVVPICSCTSSIELFHSSLTFVPPLQALKQTLAVLINQIILFDQRLFLCAPCKGTVFQRVRIPPGDFRSSR